MNVQPVPETTEDHEADSNAAQSGEPSVDHLEDRLRDLQGAMEQIQSGDLDGAEQAIEALEQRMETTRD
jgi:hypothetical protein